VIWCWCGWLVLKQARRGFTHLFAFFRVFFHWCSRPTVFFPSFFPPFFPPSPYNKHSHQSRHKLPNSYSSSSYTHVQIVSLPSVITPSLTHFPPFTSFTEQSEIFFAWKIQNSLLCCEAFEDFFAERFCHRKEKLGPHINTTTRTHITATLTQNHPNLPNTTPLSTHPTSHQQELHSPAPPRA